MMLQWPLVVLSPFLRRTVPPSPAGHGTGEDGPNSACAPRPLGVRCLQRILLAKPCTTERFVMGGSTKERGGVPYVGERWVQPSAPSGGDRGSRRCPGRGLRISSRGRRPAGRGRDGPTVAAAAVGKRGRPPGSGGRLSGCGEGKGGSSRTASHRTRTHPALPELVLAEC